MRTIGIFKMLNYDARFIHYNFEWMTTAHGLYNPTLVCEFYAASQIELKRLNKGDYRRVVIYL